MRKKNYAPKVTESLNKSLKKYEVTIGSKLLEIMCFINN